MRKRWPMWAGTGVLALGLAAVFGGQDDEPAAKPAEPVAAKPALALPSLIAASSSTIDVVEQPVAAASASVKEPVAMIEVLDNCADARAISAEIQKYKDAKTSRDRVFAISNAVRAYGRLERKPEAFAQCQGQLPPKTNIRILAQHFSAAAQEDIFEQYEVTQNSKTTLQDKLNAYAAIDLVFLNASIPRASGEIFVDPRMLLAQVGVQSMEDYERMREDVAVRYRAESIGKAEQILNSSEYQENPMDSRMRYQLKTLHINIRSANIFTSRRDNDPRGVFAQLEKMFPASKPGEVQTAPQP